MEATIKTKATTPLDLMTIQNSLTTLAQNLTKENLVFLADLSKKPDINRKIQDKKQLIKMSL